MDIVLNADTPDDLTDTLNMLLTTSSACTKIFIMWMNGENIAILIKSLTEEPFKPITSREMEIQQKFDKISR